MRSIPYLPSVLAVAITVCTLVARLACSQQNPTLQQKTQDIASFIEDVMACYHVPGLELAIVGRDQSSNTWNYIDGFGKADVVKNIDFTPDTLINVASATKAFTATLLAILLQESNERYTWDTSISDILGESFLMSTEYMTKEVNLVDLLAHRVGMPPNDALHLFGFVTEPQQVIERLYLLENKVDFRSSFVYNNLLYALAGAVAEKIGRKSWKELVKEKILDPLGMDSTTFVDEVNPDSDTFARAHYLVNNRTLVKLDYSLASLTKAIAPAAGLVSNANDMAKWMLFHLNNGKTSTGRSLLSPGSLSRTYTPSNYLSTPVSVLKPPFPVLDTLDTYALGWLGGYYRGYRQLSHSGSMLGYESMMILLPQAQIGVFVAANGAMTQLSELANRFISNYAIDVFLGQTPWLDSNTACSFPKPWAPSYSEYNPGPKAYDTSRQADRPLNEYEGTYGNFAYGQVAVKLNTTRGALEVTGGTLFHFALHPSATKDVFEVEGLDVTSFYTTRDSLKGIGSPPPTYSATFSSPGKNNEDITRVTFVLWTVEVMAFDKDVDPSNHQKPTFGCTSGTSSSLCRSYLMTFNGGILLIALRKLIALNHYELLSRYSKHSSFIEY